jgi:hypothetical protein
MVLTEKERPHQSKFACIGTEVCNKQRSIPKLFVEAFAKLAIQNELE